MNGDHPTNSIDGYIESFPVHAQVKLKEIRKIIKDMVPDAEETFAYGMPAFKIGKDKKAVVYFSGFKNHIGFYPFPSGVEEFERLTDAYEKSGKGTIQFKYDEDLPKDIIQKVVKFRIDEVERGNRIINNY